MRAARAELRSVLRPPLGEGGVIQIAAFCQPPDGGSDRLRRVPLAVQIIAYLLRRAGPRAEIPYCWLCRPLAHIRMAECVEVARREGLARSDTELDNDRRRQRLSATPPSKPKPVEFLPASRPYGGDRTHGRPRCLYCACIRSIRYILTPRPLSIASDTGKKDTAAMRGRGTSVRMHAAPSIYPFISPPLHRIRTLIFLDLQAMLLREGAREEDFLYTVVVLGLVEYASPMSRSRRC